MNLRIAFVGFGNVGRALARLLEEKQPELRRLGLSLRTTGICTRREGGIVRASGFSLGAVAAHLDKEQPLTGLPHDAACSDSLAFIHACPADVIVEITTLNYRTGEPAVSHIAAALSAGKHVVTANKGPIACAYERLNRIAKRNRVQFRFEGSVLDGLPVFNLVERTLPCSRILGFRGILNSTTNYILTQMEDGCSFEAALAKAQRLGIAEADAAADLDGWDAASKVAALANVWMQARTTPAGVRRRGIRKITIRQLERARQQGRKIRLVAGASQGRHGLRTFVAPASIPVDHPFALIRGFSNILEIQTDTMKTITLIEEDPGVRQTAYALLSDLASLGS